MNSAIQSIPLNDGTKAVGFVVKSAVLKTEAMTIQVEKLCVGFEGDAPVFRYVYEEINNDDFIIYSRFMGLDNIRRMIPDFDKAAQGVAA